MQRKMLVGLIVVVWLAGLGVGCARPGSGAGVDAGPGTGDGTQPRIGIYDSRSVAVAFAGNPEHEARTAQELAALQAAKEQGDPDKIAAADKIVWDSRKRLHRQGFSTAPVDDILALYPEQLEALKKQHHLTALVSQWDKQTLADYPDAQRIDVTEMLIDILNPNARQRRSALAIRDHKPLTPAQVEKVIQQEMRDN